MSLLMLEILYLFLFIFLERILPFIFNYSNITDMYMDTVIPQATCVVPGSQPKQRVPNHSGRG